jgi:hypothetical protein
MPRELHPGDREGARIILWAETERKKHNGSCTLTWLTLKLYLTFMLLHDPPSDREAKTSSSWIATSSRVGAIEPFEDQRQVLRRNTENMVYFFP